MLWWLVDLLEWALGVWNDRQTEIWNLLIQSPESLLGGSIWPVMEGVHNAMKGIAYGLVVLFFLMGICQSAASFKDFKRPEFVVRQLIRLGGAKMAVDYSMEAMLEVFNIGLGIINTAIGSAGGGTTVPITLADALRSAIVSSRSDFLGMVILMLIVFLGALAIWVLSLYLLLIVYGRFFKLYLYAALAPISLSAFAGHITSPTGKAFVKSYISVCLEGAVIVLACVIYTAFVSSSAPVADESLDVIPMTFQYVGQIIFNMLVLVGLVKGADRVAKEMFGL